SPGPEGQKMLRWIAVSALVAASLALGACNTVKGLGQDIQSVGQAGQDALSAGCQPLHSSQTPVAMNNIPAMIRTAFKGTRRSSLSPAPTAGTCASILPVVLPPVTATMSP